MNKKTALIILDGWGHGDKSASDGIFNAQTPFMDKLEATAPNAELLTHGEHVGLPAGQMGNSEVGHLNIGAGRVVFQELSRINQSIESGAFFENEVLLQAVQLARSENRKLHLIGLVSGGGVHSSMGHLKALCDLSKSYNLEKVFIHAFTDGRDCDPRSGKSQLLEIQEHIADGPIEIASIIGRYYAMDRDKRWERVKLAYDLLVHGKGDNAPSIGEAFDQSYANDITDEFIQPIVFQKNGAPITLIEENDVIICFNFRTDRCREISEVLTQKNHPEVGMSVLNLHYVTMTNYDSSFKNVHVIFDKENLKNTLGEVVAEAGRTQLRIAETEKYPHVTYFFSGGREVEFSKESRIMVNSPQVATYDLQPEMSAVEVANKAINFMKSDTPDFICLNFANTDMVGHTGVYEAIKKAANAVDGLLELVVVAGQELGYSFVIIADHGNSDYVINADGSPNTAHSMNPVPIVVLSEGVNLVRNGTLRDVAPTVLDLMGLSAPEEFTGSSLIS